MANIKYSMDRYKKTNADIAEMRKLRQDAIKTIQQKLGQYIIKKYPIMTKKHTASGTDWKRDNHGNIKYYPKKVYTPKDFIKHYSVAHKMINDNKHANVKTDK